MEIKECFDCEMRQGWTKPLEDPIQGSMEGGDLADVGQLLGAGKISKPFPEAREVYSSFHDTLQVAMGGKQLYGTQIAPDVAGEPVVLPLEKRAEVDAARRKLGLPPLPEALATLSREVFQGRPVQIADGEVIEAPPAVVQQAGTRAKIVPLPASNPGI